MQTPTFLDSRFEILTASLTTTNATLTTIATITIPLGTSVLITIRLDGNWIGGSSGDVSHQIGQIYNAKLKNGVGIIALNGGTSSYSLNSNHAGALGGLSITTGGAGPNQEIKVSGAANMTILWNIEIQIKRS